MSADQVLTVLGSGALAAVVTFALNSMRENLHHQRRKLEDTYCSFHDFSNDLGVMWWTTAARAEERILAQDMPELLKNDDDRGRQLQALEMIAVIHLPALAPFVERLIALRDEASGFVAPVVLQGKTGGDTAQRLHGLEVRLQSLGKEFDEAVRQEARKLRGLRAWWRV